MCLYVKAKISETSRIPLPSHNHVPGNSYEQIPERDKVCSMNSRIMILLFVLILPLEILNSTISQLLLSRLSLTFTSSGPAEHLHLTAFQSPMSELSSGHAGMSRTACVLLCCPFNSEWSDIADLVSESYEILWQFDKT